MMRLLFAAAAIGIVLTLGVTSEPNPTHVATNPMKVNQEQYERIHEPAMYANMKK
jgi:hypothetical protein